MMDIIIIISFKGGKSDKEKLNNLPDVMCYQVEKLGSF